jgi:hypothetical protein
MNSEIIGAGLATADELDPPKEDTKPAGEPKTEIPSKEIPKPVEELIQTPKPEEVQIPEQKSENIKTTITNKSGRVRTALGKK